MPVVALSCKSKQKKALIFAFLFSILALCSLESIDQLIAREDNKLWYNFQQILYVELV